jgi:hypothetical protein
MVSKMKLMNSFANAQTRIMLQNTKNIKLNVLLPFSKICINVWDDLKHSP